MPMGAIPSNRAGLPFSTHPDDIGQSMWSWDAKFLRPINIESQVMNIP